MSLNLQHGKGAKPVFSLTAIMLSLLVLAAHLHAGGFTTVETPTWNPNQPIRFVLDSGPFRSGANPISGQQGQVLVAQALTALTDIETSSLAFTDGGTAPVDIDADNFAQFENPQALGAPIIFDADGAITSMIFGGNEAGDILGFAGSFDSTGDGFLDYGLMVLNGPESGDNRTTRTTIRHEWGHVIGLDHTQAGKDSFDACNFANPDPCANIPLMYPFLLVGLDSVNEFPIADDIAWISRLYPSPDFGDKTGTIQGRVLRRAGLPFQGANVVAVPVDTSPQGNGALQAAGRVSSVSDFGALLSGGFELPGLAAGSYAVFVEPLQADFTMGSNVGPFDQRFTDFPLDFYNGDDESGDSSDDPLEFNVIQVAAGQTVIDIELITNDASDEGLPDTDLTTIGDDDSRVVLFPEGFRFPFFGRLFSGVHLNSDGNLTFFRDDISSAARSEARFLAGEPRIAPLFTDLDPSEAGSITTEQVGSTFRIKWNGVPEWSQGGGAPPNTFSVTLFGNGNILFNYEAVAVTPDGPVASIVGVTPGGFAPGSGVDLSALSSPISLVGPAYQVFQGGQFDLVGAQILFDAGTGQFALLYPFYRGASPEFSGFALTHDDTDEAILQVEGRAGTGALLGFPDNPHFTTLGRKKQIARLGSDFFGIDPENQQSGWVRILSDRERLASFFQIGDGLTGTITKLDGSVAFTEQSKVLYFTRLHDGPGSFQTISGPRDATTLIAVANPNDTPITVSFRLFNTMGQSLGNAVIRQLPALGCLRESLSSLFGLQGPVSNGLVRADVTSGPGAIGFELVELSNTILGFNASFGNSQSTSYSAQLAHGTQSGLAIFTSLKLANTSAVPRSITLTAIKSDGSVIRVFGPFTLQSNESFQRQVGEIFQLGPSTGPATTGSLLVEATGPGIVGNVLFGDPNSLTFGAALPLATRLVTRAIFSQVANANVPGNAAFSTFTGLAFHNPDPVQTAQITLRVFDEAGLETGSTVIQLGPGNRATGTVAQLMPSTAGQVRGYILVESTVPVVAQQLFGNFALSFLSAVPPTVFQ